MEEVRNAANRLVCQIDKQNKVVEIVIKGYKTTIRFLTDGSVEIINAEAA